MSAGLAHRVSERRRSRACCAPLGLLGALLVMASAADAAGLVPPRGLVDPRVRTVTYDPEQVIKLQGYVGYQIHFQFADGEEFVNLGAGDSKALDVGAERNNLVLKPLAPQVATNLTIFTNRRVYHFDYVARARPPDFARDEVIYSLRFVYPADEARRAAAEAERVRLSQRLAAGVADRPRNFDYWFCGTGALRPVSAHDDGVQTRLRFAARAEFPAIFVKNDDESESVLNFNVEADEVVIHRVVRRLVLRRGALVGCIENRGFDGGGAAMRTQTVVPGIERRTRGVDMP